MCIGGGRSSAPVQPAPQIVNQPQKPVVYMRNNYLDGLGINAEQSGRNSLRIDLGSPTPMKPQRTGGPLPPQPIVTPNLGIGGLGGPGGPYRRGLGIDGHGGIGLGI